MEAFEQVARLALEADGFAVSTGVKFRLAMKTSKKAYDEVQTHGYEVDLVGARGDRLVLASVKSFFGSKGVQASSFSASPDSSEFKRYRLLIDRNFQGRIRDAACERYGYKSSQIELRFYAGMFKSNKDEARIRETLKLDDVGVCGPTQIVKSLLAITKTKTYQDDAVVATMRLLQLLVPTLADQL
jgi:hypothetical protein